MRGGAVVVVSPWGTHKKLWKGQKGEKGIRPRMKTDELR
jgi:hypothetical protein